jgi:hypothetical protein
MRSYIDREAAFIDVKLMVFSSRIRGLFLRGRARMGGSM